MTRQDIMQMDERELYYRLYIFIEDGYRSADAPPYDYTERTMFSVCYQAEEKLILQGTQGENNPWIRYIKNLWEIACEVPDIREDGYPMVLWHDLGDITHAHPKQRAQAVLLTVEEKNNGEDR